MSNVIKREKVVVKLDKVLVDRLEALLADMDPGFDLVGELTQDDLKDVWADILGYVSLKELGEMLDLVPSYVSKIYRGKMNVNSDKLQGLYKRSERILIKLQDEHDRRVDVYVREISLDNLEFKSNS